MFFCFTSNIRNFIVIGSVVKIMFTYLEQNRDTAADFFFSISSRFSTGSSVASKYSTSKLGCSAGKFCWFLATLVCQELVFRLVTYSSQNMVQYFSSYKLRIRNNKLSVWNFGFVQNLDWKWNFWLDLKWLWFILWVGGTNSVRTKITWILMNTLGQVLYCLAILVDIEVLSRPLILAPWH